MEPIDNRNLSPYIQVWPYELASPNSYLQYFRDVRARGLAIEAFVAYLEGKGLIAQDWVHSEECIRYEFDWPMMINDDLSLVLKEAEGLSFVHIEPVRYTEPTYSYPHMPPTSQVVVTFSTKAAEGLFPKGAWDLHTRKELERFIEVCSKQLSFELSNLETAEKLSNPEEAYNACSSYKEYIEYQQDAHWATISYESHIEILGQHIEEAKSRLARCG